MKTSYKEKFQNIIIAIFLIIGFYFTLLGSYNGYETYNGWSIGDWLINYQGGFVRRGLLGEFIYKLSIFSGYSPGLIVFWLQALFYFLFFIFAYLSLIHQKTLRLQWLLIFSPFIFYFQVFAGEGGYRKEIIFIAILAFIVWTSKKFRTEKLEMILVVTLFFYPLVILTHEMLAVFLPYIVILYCFKIPLTRKRIVYLIPLLLLSIIAFLLSYFYHGDHSTVNAILNSLESAGYKPKSGAIDWLDKNIDFARNDVKSKVSSLSYYKVYFTVTFMAILAYVPIFSRVQKILKNKVCLILFILTITSSVALFATALDWGRIIYINLVSIFLISLVPEDSNPKPICFANWTFISILSVIYFSIWSIPHFGGYQPVFKTINSTNIEVLLKRGFGQ